MRRRWIVVVGAVLLCLPATALWAPVFAPDAALDDHLVYEADLVGRTHDVFDNLSNASHSPYGPIQSFEVRRHERRNLIQLGRGHSSAVVVLRTDRGLVVERISSSDLGLGRFATLTHTELRPDDVPAGVLTAVERRQHHTDVRARGVIASPYTTGGFDG